MQAARELLERVGSDWLRETAMLIAAETAELAPAFAAAPRQVGRAPLPPGPALCGPDDPVATDGWTVDDAARAVLLLASDLDAVWDVYRGGDSREKRAIVRALPLLPDGAALVELALDAGRTNERDLFAALALGNPYPQRHYGELEWNKLVMKAVFVGLPLDAVVGLERRANPELTRMAHDYAAERRAAARPCPDDLWLLTGASP
ncbi:MAG TPA: EboA domain-containing protein [Kofleriaceae bacterium]|nr:EboA domain-containing protein [Kofleriaceae bacterium]